MNTVENTWINDNYEQMRVGGAGTAGTESDRREVTDGRRHTDWSNENIAVSQLRGCRPFGRGLLGCSLCGPYRLLCRLHKQL